MASSSETDEDLTTILSEQRREFALAKALETDLDFAFEVQMQEAMTASLALKPSPSESDGVVPPESFVGSEENVDVLAMAEAFIQSDIESYARECEDRELCEAVMRAAKEDLGRRIHDQRVAGEVAALPEDYWSDYGDWYEKPHGSSSSSSAPENSGAGECLRLYFKGLVSEERVRDSNVVVAGAGIAICDPKNNLLFHSRNNLEAFYGGQMASGEMAELEALCEGLDKAIAFGFKRLIFICFDSTLHNYVINRSRPRNGQTATLINKVNLLRAKFSHCIPHLAAENEANPAFKSAREAVVSQIRWSDPTIEGKGKQRPRETCVICFEDTDVAEMFSIDRCLHRYCFPCMKRHVEAKLHGGQAAKCPHEGCNSEVAVESCAEFLPPNLVEVMGQRMKESAIPAVQRIYCPDPKCSALMSKSEALAYTKAYFVGAEKSNARKCVKCQKFFCIDCKVSWHYERTCEVNRSLNPNGNGDEQMLKSLAKKKLWRQCAKCSHMVELAEGCYHITCRCGYEFCYTCGAEWKNKSPTCVCPIWDERNIIRRQPQPQQQ